MTIRLPDDKKLKLVKTLNYIKNKNYCLVTDFASIIGKLVAACPAVKYSWVHIKNLERDKFKTR